jgi:hypothetical protein
MPRSNPQPPAAHGLVRLLDSAMVWAVTGAVMTVARRPPWHAVGVVLMVLGLGVVGWVVRPLLRQQPPRQQTNGMFPHRSSRPGHRIPPRRQGGRHERVPARHRVRAAHHR